MTLRATITDQKALSEVPITSIEAYLVRNGWTRTGKHDWKKLHAYVRTPYEHEIGTRSMAADDGGLRRMTDSSDDDRDWEIDDMEDEDEPIAVCEGCGGDVYEDMGCQMIGGDWYCQDCEWPDDDDEEDEDEEQTE